MTSKKTLVVVESPAKAGKIQKYLGDAYVVKASCGHIIDLPSRKLGVDLKSKDFKMETTVIPGKQKIITELRKWYKKCGQSVILAPDPDREGEAIGYYICKAIGAEPYTTPRASFHEITSGAIKKAIANPGTLCPNAVNAQMARRALDRILGYKISPVVKKHTITGKSAGRCQSPSLLMLKQREDEITEQLKDKDSRTIVGVMVGTINEDTWEVKCDMFEEFPKKDCNFVKQNWRIQSVVVKRDNKSNPPPPFITSTLLSSATNHLGMTTKSAKAQMQKMYEKGLITYIRTDSTTISKSAQNQVSNYLKKELNLPCVQRAYGSNKKHAQEAHECIRPTMIERHPSDVDAQFRRLYELIWKRTIASQMKEALSDSIAIEVLRYQGTKISKKHIWKGSKSYCTYAGWKALDDTVEIKRADIPIPKKKDEFKPVSAVVSEMPPAVTHRYSDSTFVSKLEKCGIGRPSTYATIIETIKMRGYAKNDSIEGIPLKLRQQTHTSRSVKEASKELAWGSEKNRLVLTDLGHKVCECLYPTWDSLLGIESTSTMEDMLDKVCSGDVTYVSTIDSYWSELSKLLESELVDLKSNEKSSKTSKTKSKLGTQTLDGIKYDILFEMTRYGPAVVRFDPKKDTKVYGNIPKGTDVSTMTVEQAISYLPMSFKKINGKTVNAKVGPYGPYIVIGSGKGAIYINIDEAIWNSGLKQTDVDMIWKRNENELSHAAKLSKLNKLVKEIKKGPKGWYAVLSMEPKGKGKKTTKNKSLGPDILQVTDDVILNLS